MFLVLVFVISAASLIVLLWMGTLAGAILALFLTLWCLIAVNSADPVTLDIPYGTLFTFSPKVEKYKKDAKEIWVIDHKNKKPQKYELSRDGKRRYRQAGTGGTFPRAKVEAIILKDEAGESRFEPASTPEGSDYTEFRDAEGWMLRVYYGEGPFPGNPVAFRWGRFFGALFLNFAHLGLWFACLWLLLRFQWGHALGFALIMWFILTLAILPLLFEQAALEARRNAQSVQAGTRILPLAAWRASAKPKAARPHADARMCMMSPSCTT
jgi:hypothetical protein